MIRDIDNEQGLDVSLLTTIKQKGLNVLWHNRKFSAIFVLIGANILNNLVSFFINIIIAKKYGPEIYGIFALATASMMAVHLIADLGLSLTIVRFFNLYADDPRRQNELVVSLLILKLLITFVIVLASLPLASVAMKLFKLHESNTTLFALSVASAGIFGLWVYFESYLQAHRQFLKYAIYTILYGFLRIVCFSLVYFVFDASANLPLTFITLYTGPVLIILGFGLSPVAIYLFKQGIPKLSVIRNRTLEVLKYSKWVAISSICNSYIYRGVQFVLAAHTSSFELGIFSAGFVFTLAFSPFNMAVRTVFFPHVTAYNDSEMVRYLRRIRKILPYLIILIVVGICCLAVIQIAFLGKQYAMALPVFLITSSALTLMNLLGLVSMLVHTLMRPEIDAYTNIGRLIVSCVLVYLLAHSMGAIGGALSYALPIVLGEILMVLYVRRLIHERE